MGVLYPDNKGEWWAPKTSACFTCGEVVQQGDIATYWAGTPEGEGERPYLLLHVDCAERLGADLIGDAREAKMARGAEYWGGRAARAMREVLEQQEHGHG